MKYLLLFYSIPSILKRCVANFTTLNVEYATVKILT